jgi:nucleotide-binding universal stress UspA family protein
MLVFKKIVCPTDYSEPSYEGLKYAIELVQQFEAELLIVHIIAPLPQLPEDPNFTFGASEYARVLNQAAEQQLREVTQKRVPSEIRLRTLIKHGDPGTEIVQVAEEEAADLIVMATHGSTGWRHLVFGSVAERVIRLAGCPVLTIRVPVSLRQ